MADFRKEIQRSMRKSEEAKASEPEKLKALAEKIAVQLPVPKSDLEWLLIGFPWLYNTVYTVIHRSKTINYIYYES